jgi:REP element-mobilizing transposase RayT
MIMKIDYNNLYTHFVFTTQGRQPLILEKNRGRIEKYITGIINHNSCKLYAIYANPEHGHFLVSRSPDMSEESLARWWQTAVAASSMKINSPEVCSADKILLRRFLCPKQMWTNSEFAPFTATA